MTTLGIIGAGNIGGAVAQLAVDAGIDVVIANSRGPETLRGLVDRLGPRASAATAADAASAADIAVVTVPLKAYEALPAGELAGKVVLDTCNYYPDRDGRFDDLDADATTTSELVQQHLATSQVVKAFNNIYFRSLAAQATPHGDPQRVPLVIAGDDADAKRAATELLDRLGYDAYDAGSLADSWRFERDRPAYAGLYMQGDDIEAFHRPDVAEIEAKLAEATR